GQGETRLYDPTVGLAWGEPPSLPLSALSDHVKPTTRRSRPSPVLCSRIVSTNGPRATLALEDGLVFEGRSFGAAGETTGEVVFSEIDTRALTRHLRTHGAKRGVVSTRSADHEELVAKARASRSMVGLDLAREVTCPEPYHFGTAPAPHSYKVVAYDFGMKQ